MHTAAGENKLLQVYAAIQHGLTQLLVLMLVQIAELVVSVIGTMILIQAMVADIGYQIQIKQAAHVVQ